MIKVVLVILPCTLAIASTVTNAALQMQPTRNTIVLLHTRGSRLRNSGKFWFCFEEQNLFTWSSTGPGCLLCTLGEAVGSPPLEVFRDQVDEGMDDGAMEIILL